MNADPFPRERARGALTRRQLLRSGAAAAGVSATGLSGCLGAEEFPVSNVWMQVVETPQGLRTVGILNSEASRNASDGLKTYFNGAGTKGFERADHSSLVFTAPGSEPVQAAPEATANLRRKLSDISAEYQQLHDSRNPTTDAERFFYSFVEGVEAVDELCQLRGIGTTGSKSDLGELGINLGSGTQTKLLSASVEKWQSRIEGRTERGFRPYRPPTGVIHTDADSDLYRNLSYIERLVGFELPNFAERRSDGGVKLNPVELRPEVFPNPKSGPLRVLIQLPDGYQYFRALTKDQRKIGPVNHYRSRLANHIRAVERYKYQLVSRLRGLFWTAQGDPRKALSMAVVPFSRTAEFLYDLMSSALGGGYCAAIGVGKAILTYARDIHRYFEELDRFPVHGAEIDFVSEYVGRHGNVPRFLEHSGRSLSAEYDLNDRTVADRTSTAKSHVQLIDDQRELIDQVRAAARGSGLRGTQFESRDEQELYRALQNLTVSLVGGVQALCEWQQSALERWAQRGVREASGRNLGRHFSVEPNSETELLALQKPSGEGSYDTRRFRVRIRESGDADGTYGLERITTDPSFDPGDTYRLNQSTLGLSEPFDWMNSTVALEYRRSGEWLNVVRAEF